MIERYPACQTTHVFINAGGFGDKAEVQDLGIIGAGRALRN